MTCFGACLGRSVATLFRRCGIGGWRLAGRRERSFASRQIGLRAGEFGLRTVTGGFAAAFFAAVSVVGCAASFTRRQRPLFARAGCWRRDFAIVFFRPTAK